MDKAVILALDARRRVRDARKEAGVKLTDVKRAISAELREIASSIPKADDVAALVLGRIELPQPVHGRDGRDAVAKDGHDGHGIASAKIEKGHLILVRDDGKELDAGPLPKGKDGEQSLLRLRQKVPDTIITATLTPAITYTAVTPYAVASTDGLVVIDSSAGAKVVTMPPAADSNRQIFTILRDGASIVTVNTQGSDTFNVAGASLVLHSNGEAVEVCGDSARSKWWIK